MYRRYDILLLVAGGIGITPFLSVLQEIASIRSNGRHTYPKRIQLIYAVKKSQDISLLNPVMAQLLDFEQRYIKLKVFVTQEVQSGSRTLGEVLNEVSQVKTIDFETTCSSYAAYGVESLRWMAAIVGLSCIIFLVLLISFNQSIHPHGEKASGQKIPSSVTDLYLICSFIMAIICSSLLAIILRWKRVKKELPSFSGVKRETTKPTTMGIDNTLVEHEIYFGERPDFKGTILCNDVSLLGLHSHLGSKLAHGLTSCTLYRTVSQIFE